MSEGTLLAPEAVQAMVDSARESVGVFAETTSMTITLPGWIVKVKCGGHLRYELYEDK